MPVWKKTLSYSLSQYGEMGTYSGALHSWMFSLGSTYTSLRNAGFSIISLSATGEARNGNTSGNNYRLYLAGNNGSSNNGPQISSSTVWISGTWQWATLSGSCTNQSQILAAIDSSNRLSLLLWQQSSGGYYGSATLTLVLQKTTTVTAGNPIYVGDFKINDSFYVPSSLAKGNPIKYGSTGSTITASYWNSVTINL